jgi:TonB family protein
VDADDEADYEAAESLLKEACDIAIEQQDAAGQQLVCTRLAQVHSVQSRYKQAETTLEDLVGRLEAIENVYPNLVVRSRLELANVRSARANFDSTREAVQGVGPYLSRLRTSDLVDAYVKIAQFYLPIDRQAPGGDMLREAIKALDLKPDFDDFRYVRAAGRLANALESSNRLHDANTVREPFVREARIRFERGRPLENLLQGAYFTVAGDYARLLSMKGKEKEARAVRQEITVWRKIPPAASTRKVVAAKPSEPVYRVAGNVSAPKLLKKAEPRMTEGALANRAQGKVLLSLQVWPDGRVHRVAVLRPLPYGLHWEAIGAVRKWRFEPGRKDGKPVKVAAAVEVTFAFR